MLYEFGNCSYGLFALNLADNYAMRIKQDQSDSTKATVHFEVGTPQADTPAVVLSYEYNYTVMNMIIEAT